MILDAPPIRDGTGKELRRLHDVAQQHLRALKSLGEEPSHAFITSIIELKLDATTAFEWQRHTHCNTKVPHYREILEFIDHRAQASEISVTTSKRPHKTEPNSIRKSLTKAIPSYAANHETNSNLCPHCKSGNHPLYSCPRFRSLSPDKRLAVVKETNLCMNCLGKGHYASQCKSLHRCRRCQNNHHSLLHLDQAQANRQRSGDIITQHSLNGNTGSEVSVNTVAAGLKSNTLLMTCEVLLQATDGGASVKVRALLDSGSSASFVSERIVQSPRVKQGVFVSGIGGVCPESKIQSSTNFKLSPTFGKSETIDVAALVIPRVTRELPITTIPYDRKWKHLRNVQLADPKFNVPGRIDVLLGVDVFTAVLRQGRWKGTAGTPVAIETIFGWVLCGALELSIPEVSSITSCHSSIETGDDIIRKFWRIEEPPTQSLAQYSQQERIAIQHFKNSYTRSEDGQFVVPLPRSSDGEVLGESRSQAVRRFLSLERSLGQKGRFYEFDAVIREYLELKHAELIPSDEIERPVDEVFYLPMHAVYKSTSTTTKIRAVFDAIRHLIE